MKEILRIKRTIGPPAHRGAALVFALAAVLIISLLILGVGRLVLHHFVLEESSRSYSRSIYIAEAAANWQINRMSRSAKPGAPALPGRIAHNQIYNFDNHGALPDHTNTFNVNGTAQVWVMDANATRNWEPPNDFNLYAVGTDPITGVQRGIFGRGRAVTLGDRYALFGQNGIHFNNANNGPPAARTGVCTLQQGYIASNGAVTFAGNPPIGGVASPQYVFGGCRLGPQGTIMEGAWIQNWDIPRLTDPIRWPLIDEIFQYVYNGLTPANMAALNENIQIEYLDGTIFKRFSIPPAPILRLTSAEFGRSPQRTLKLTARSNSPTGNVFYFEDIQMGPNDILVLDLRKPPGEPATAIRILINGPVSGQDIRITNLAYYTPTDPNISTPNPAYLWFNNTDKPIHFAPSLNPATHGPVYTNAAERYQFELRPGIQGMVYGINAFAAPNNQAGSVEVDGSADFPVTIHSIIANSIQLNGRMTVSQPASIEDPADAMRYVLYYSIRTLYEADAAAILAGNINPPVQGHVVGYGRY